MNTEYKLVDLPGCHVAFFTKSQLEDLPDTSDSLSLEIEVVQHIARKTSRGVGQFHYDAWQRSWWLWPSVTKRASTFSQSVCGSEYHCSYAICCFKELATQNGSDLMGCLPSKDRSKKEQWSSCGDSPWYWSQHGSAVAIAEATRMGWLV